LGLRRNHHDAELALLSSSWELHLAFVFPDGAMRELLIAKL
jgi:tetraacyldisaccharide-1-P 4'-kinase